MNKISKKLLLCVLLTGSILMTNSVHAKAVAAETEDERDIRIATQAFSAEAKEKRAARAAAKESAESEPDYTGISDLYKEEETTAEEAAATDEAEEKPEKTRYQKRRSDFRKKAKARRKKAKGAKKGDKGVLQKARKKRRVKPWQQEQHKKPSQRGKSRDVKEKISQSSKKIAQLRDRRIKQIKNTLEELQSKPRPWTERQTKRVERLEAQLKKLESLRSSQKISFLRKKLKQLTQEPRPWTKQQTKRIEQLRERFKKVAPRPYTQEDAALLDEA